MLNLINLTENSLNMKLKKKRKYHKYIYIYILIKNVIIRKTINKIKLIQYKNYKMTLRKKLRFILK